MEQAVGGPGGGPLDCGSPATDAAIVLSDLLHRSAASEPFRTAVARFLRDGQPCDRVRFDSRAPPVKVERTLAQLLECYATLPIDAVDVEGVSGCEFFRGVAVVRAGGEERRVRFHWDCRWRAEQEGWTDPFGFTDQARAAREFGHRCFRVWEETEPAASDQAS